MTLIYDDTKADDFRMKMMFKGIKYKPTGEQIINIKYHHGSAIIILENREVSVPLHNNSINDYIIKNK